MIKRKKAMLVRILLEELLDESGVLIADEIALAVKSEPCTDIGSGQESLVRDLSSHCGRRVSVSMFLRGWKSMKSLPVEKGAGSLLVDCTQEESTTYATYTQLLLLLSLR
jgi:hypothetical protein